MRPFRDVAVPPQEQDVDVAVRPSTAAAGLGLWILAGVLTHVAVRLVDRWFFDGK